MRRRQQQRSQRRAWRRYHHRRHCRRDNHDQPSHEDVQQHERARASGHQPNRHTPASPTVSGVGQSSPAATWTPAPNTGTIAGTVTDRDTGKPVPAVYITVGYKSVMLTTLTDEAGHYIVRNVPAGQPADVFGFHGGGFRYHNSLYDDNLHIMVQSGQTYRYDFQVYQLNDPAGEPHVDHPAINPASAAPGQTVTFSLTASDGKGGLSDEVMAASPTLGRLVLLKPAGGDNFGGSFTIPDQTAPGDYAFAFFAASNDCYDNHTFPRLTLHVAAP